jgi:hypothetical protein
MNALADSTGAALTRVAVAAVAAWAAIIVVLAELIHHQLLAFWTVLPLCFLFTLLVMLVAACAWRLYGSARASERATAAVVALAVLLLGELGVLGRAELDGIEGAQAANQQFGVAGVILLGFLAAAAAWSLPQAKPAPLVIAYAAGVVVLVILWWDARPGDLPVRPGVAYPRNWPEPLVDLALLGLLAGALRGIRERLRVVPEHALALIAPLTAVLAFAYSRDPATVALAVGAVTLWAVAERLAGRTPSAVAWWTALGGYVLGMLAVFALGWLENAPRFTPTDVFGTEELRSPAALTRFWVGPGPSVAPWRRIKVLIPMGSAEAWLIGLALTVVYAVLLWHLAVAARRVEARTAAFAAALVAFVGVQWAAVLLASARLLDLGLPTPLLGGSVPWDAADAIAIGLVIGLSARTRTAAAAASGRIGRRRETAGR